MRRRKVRAHWNGWNESVKRVCSIRFASAAILMAALVCAIASGIDRLMLDTKEWITPWMAPHFFDNVYFVTFYGLVVCYMYSDVPFMNRSELCFVMRKGRRIWCTEKIFAIIMQAFSFTALTMLASVLVFVPRLHFETEWGKIPHTLAYSNNLWDYNIIGKASPAILTKYTPIQAMFICFLLVGIVSSMIGLLMFAISMYGSRLAAVSIAVILTGMTLSDGVFITSPWLFYVTPFNWCRMGQHDESFFLDVYYPSLQTCLCLCGIMTVLIILSIILKSGHVEFDWNQEE